MKIVYFNKIALCILITCILFSGCSDKATDSIDVNKGSNLTGKGQQARTLTFYFIGYGVHDDFENIEKEIEDRLRGTLNIDLDFKCERYSNNSTKDITNIINSGAPCDAIIVSHEINLNELVNKDLLMDISHLFPKHAPLLYQKLSSDGAMAVGTYNGKLLAIPANMPSSQRPCVLLRADLAEKYQISSIDTLSNLSSLLRVLKNNEYDTYPLDVSFSSQKMFIELYGYKSLDGFLVYRDNGSQIKLIPWEQTEEFREQIAFLQQWKQNGYMGSGDNAAAGLMSMSAIPIWRQNGLYKVFPLVGSSKATKTYNSIPSIAISRNSQNADLVLQFIEWVEAYQKNYNLLMYGIEGQNYTMKDNKIDLDSYKGNYYKWNVLEPFKNIDYINTIDTCAINYLDAYLQDISSNSEPPPHWGFNPTYTEVLQQIHDTRNSTFSGTSGLVDKFRIGGFDGDISNLITQMREARSETYLQDIQSQLDEWLKQAD